MNELTKIIKSIIKETGPITFKKFMGLALYHKKYGYYTAGKRIIGKEGDYYTSPCVHPAFGEVIGNLIQKAHELMEIGNFSIVEIGAEKGLLAQDILDAIKRNNPKVYRDIKYTIVEYSQKPVDQGKTSLKKHSEKISRKSSISELGPNSVSGVLISNELVDSFPFHRAKIENGQLKEMYIDLEDDNFIEIFDHPSTKEIQDYFQGYNIEFLEGQEVEINLIADKWLREVSTVFYKGLVITIDYGFLAQELFNPSRLKGTYKCLYKHTISDNPYINIGEQDITAHVDFSNLIRVGESEDLKTTKYTTQGQFLIDWGILDIVERYSTDNKTFDITEQKNVMAIKNLFLPELMGERFKVLIQEKSMGNRLKYFYPNSPFKISFQIPPDSFDYKS